MLLHSLNLFKNTNLFHYITSIPHTINRCANIMIRNLIWKPDLIDFGPLFNLFVTNNFIIIFFVLLKKYSALHQMINNLFSCLTWITFKFRQDVLILKHFINDFIKLHIRNIYTAHCIMNYWICKDVSDVFSWIKRHCQWHLRSTPYIFI